MAVTEVFCEMPSRQMRINREALLRRDRRYWVLRRGQDIVFSLMALIVLFIPMLIVALAIVLDDPGCSPIFSQMRVGRDGKQFRLYKFRSMVADAEALRSQLDNQNEMNGPVFKIKDDPRITKVGHFLRKTSIDELPQLWNILQGDMSIVGPRPALPDEVSQYNEYLKVWGAQRYILYANVATLAISVISTLVTVYLLDSIDLAAASIMGLYAIKAKLSLAI